MNAKPGTTSPVSVIRNAATTAKISVTKLRGNISVLQGSGGNIPVLTGREGKVLVNASIPGSRPRITEALASLSNDPVKHLINSHWHFDHTDGNDWLHSTGAEITAHGNTRKHLSVTTRVEGWNFTFRPTPPSALPTKVFDDEQTIHLNGTTLALKYIHRRILTRTSQSYSATPTSSMWRTLFGMLTSHSSITQPVAASTE